jgi:hypothetical protein
MGRRNRSVEERLGFKFTTKDKLPLTKFDVARRQLETAITLWFHDGDVVSVHTLTMAAHEILCVINKSRGGPPMLGEPCPQIREGFTDLYRDVTLASYKFFKHASRDADETHLFPPAVNQCVILDAQETYHRLTNDIRPLFKLFKWYLRVHMPEFFLEPLQDWGRFKGLTKAQFFSELLPFSQAPESIGRNLR